MVSLFPFFLEGLAWLDMANTEIVRALLDACPAGAGRHARVPGADRGQADVRAVVMTWEEAREAWIVRRKDSTLGWTLLSNSGS